MWPQLLMYGVPAALGGLAAYKQSGGNIGATALGAGLGAGGGGLLRMAGTAIGGAPALAGALGNASTRLTGKAAALANLADAPGLAGAAARTGSAGLGKLGALATPAGIGAAAATLGSGLAGGIGGALAAGTSNAVGSAARNVLGAGNTLLPGAGPNASGVYQFEQNAIPQNADPTFGYGSPYGTMADIKNPLGRFAASQEAEKIAFDTQLRNMQLQFSAMAPWTEGAKKAELARNLYAATVRNNLATQQELLLGGVRNARAMGANAANQVGNALASQYQYS